MGAEPRSGSKTAQIHASCVAVGDAGVLLRGPSGAGKSDLALRLIDAGAVLVADDRVDLRVEGGALRAAVPETLAGLLEVRGVGIVRMHHAGPVTVRLCVDLVAADAVFRLPEAATVEIAGVRVRHLALHSFHASTPAKIRLTLATPMDDMVEPR